MSYPVLQPATGDVRRDIAEVCRRVYYKGWVAANDGNVSVRVDENRVVVTPTGVSKGEVTPEMLVETDLEGRPLSPGRPSSEILMHLYCYRERPDVKAVVHAHPPFATGFAVAGIPLERCILPEIVVTIGSVPLAPYGTPGTEELPKTLAPYLRKGDAFLLANHGAVTLGRTLFEAYYQMERVEHLAKISFVARTLGNENILGQQAVEKLFALRQRAGFTGANPGCYACTTEGSFSEGDGMDLADFQQIVHRGLESVR